ncbi:MAG: hypothetical protein CML68_12385 [Rhodobacteraceae bacterium]|nr:hypothetical protein [Paracoccaceae bacterium]
MKQTPSPGCGQGIDRALYKERHLLERVFDRIRRIRRTSLRCEKTTSSFRAFIALACTMTWLA